MIENLDEYIAYHHLSDYEIPWWAVALVDTADPNEQRVRRFMMDGHVTKLRAPIFWETWQKLVERARVTVAQKSLPEWRALCEQHTNPVTLEGDSVAKKIREAALSSPRAFSMWVGLEDSDKNPIILKPFHARIVNSFRRVENSVCLIPYEHGKTYLTSILIPLMDWAEWPDAIECRVYLDQDTIREWVPKCEQEVEYNESLHALFPWVRRPRKGDKSQRWNENSFSIGGRSNADASFRSYTIRSRRMGKRSHRPIVDDIVTSGECDSPIIQDGLSNWISLGAKTMPMTTTRQSRYGTKWGTFGHAGTLFSPIDANMKVYETFKDLRDLYPDRYSVLKFDIYPKGANHPDIVLWPEWKPPKKVLEMAADLGKVNFDLRCRNRVHIGGLVTFSEAKVKAAEHDGQSGKPIAVFGQVPDNCRIGIGLDPGSGKVTRSSANPAIVLYGEREFGGTTYLGPLAATIGQDYVSPNKSYHIIRWQRMIGYSFPRQCETAIEWALTYNCPIYLEDNTLQGSYAEYIWKISQEVIVRADQTGINKRDPRDGVEQFAPLFDNNLMVIHAMGAPPDELVALRKEWTSWRGGRGGRFSDLVMATWGARHQMEIERKRETMPPPQSYARTYFGSAKEGSGGMFPRRTYVIDIPN